MLNVELLKTLDREYVQQLINLAHKCRQEEDFSTAIACYRRILWLQPQRASIYLQLGNIFNQQQQIDRAREAYQQAVTLQPSQPAWVYQTLGKLLQQRQHDTEAISAYQQAIALDPQSPAWVYRNLGNLLNQQEQYAQAIAIYQQLIELVPHNAAEIQIKIGDIFTKQAKFFAAKAAYEKARTLRTLLNINQIIRFIHKYFVTDVSPLNIDILDNGCEPTGRQLVLLAEQTQGRVVGTNVCWGFPDQSVKHRRFNNEFYWMDGQNLTFSNGSFNLVISLNVLEHVPNPAKYLQECFRVMRPGGFGYFSWYPIWSGATGHHVHPDMVSRTAQQLGIKPPNYSLDGSSIPRWGHLLFSPSEMLSFLIEEKQYDPALAEWMKDYIYYGNNINRWFWRDVWQAFQNIPWNLIEIDHRPGNLQVEPKILKQLLEKYGISDDFQICGATIIVQK